MKTRIASVGFTCALVAGVAFDAAAAESYTLYDNFSTTRIDAAKWLQPERSRLVKNGTLSHIQRDLGSQASNAGAVPFNFNTNFDDPQAITQIRATVNVQQMEVSGCDANASASQSVARVVGDFFNAGNPVPGTRINDVISEVRVIRTSNSAGPPNVLRIEGVVAQCLNAECDGTGGSQTLGSVSLGTVPVGADVVLRMDWDPPNNRFVFRRDTQAAKSVTYTVPDSLPATLPFKALGTRTNLANCFGGARTEGFVRALFDGVAVNESAAP